MTVPFKGTINIDIRDSVPDWGPYEQPAAPEGAPSVLYVVLDDVGYSAMEPFGGLIETPNINRIAERGLSYTNFHTTALCSPTRSCLLTGRNHTTNGMACISEAASGFPNANAHIPFECATIPEVLGERGWNTYMVGKWHLCAEDEMNLASIKHQWPLGRGFERFYGFLGAETNQWYPDLCYDNHPVEQPKSPEEGYHFTTDITDRALGFIRDAKAVAPDKPFFLYYAPGACHAPHHVPKEWTEKYKGKFDMGYERFRELVFERQQKMGLLPDGAELSPINPYADAGGEGQSWPELDTVRPWDSLSDDERRLFCRMAEVYAGFLSHTDHELGRLLDYLEDTEQLDNTIVVLVSDNGASGEGGPNGSVNENKLFNGVPDTMEENLKYLDDLGGPRTYNHYPTGWAWAFNTPFKMWKRYSNYEGGTADPMIVSWPSEFAGAGEVRRQYTHAVDIVPTLYDCLGLELPETVKGHVQHPLEGVSFAASLDDAQAQTGKQTQFFSMLGTRAIWHQGWKAAALSPASPNAWADFAGQQWELFNTELDPSECHDLAAEEPGRLQELIALWWSEAGRYHALPLESRDAVAILTTPRPQVSKPRNRYTYYPGCAEVPESAAPNIRNRSYTIAAEVMVDTQEAGGVLFSQGARFGGHALYVKDGRLKYVYNWVGIMEQIVESSETIPTGHVVLSAAFEKRGETMPTEGALSLYINDDKVGEGEIRTQPGKFSLAGEGLNVAKDGGEAVTDDYPGVSPWPFVGGTVERVFVDVSGEPFVDLAKEAAALFARE